MPGRDKKISANEAINRIQNILRGMVSPTYVATEAAIRKSMKKPTKKAGGGKVKKKK